MNEKNNIKKFRPFIIAGAGIVIIAYLTLLVYLSSHQRYDYVIYGAEQTSYTFAADATENYTIPISIKNKSNEIISSINGDKLYLSYHVYNGDGELISYDNVYSEIKKGIFCGDKKTVDLQITPLPAGVYRLEIDLVNTKDGYWVSDWKVTQPLWLDVVVQ